MLTGWSAQDSPSQLKCVFNGFLMAFLQTFVTTLQSGRGRMMVGVCLAEYPWGRGGAHSLRRHQKNLATNACTKFSCYEACRYDVGACCADRYPPVLRTSHTGMHWLNKMQLELKKNPVLSRIVSSHSSRWLVVIWPTGPAGSCFYWRHVLWRMVSFAIHAQL